MRCIVRPPGAAFRDAISSHPARDRIDVARAIREHAAFVAALEAAGATVTCLDADPELPDATFVSDTLVALPRPGGGGTAMLVVARPALPSRRAEVASVLACVTAVLAPDLPFVAVPPPATLEGGDVVVFGERIAIGVSARTSEDGARVLADAARTLGYRAFLCPVPDRLHLATAVTAVGADLLLGTAAGFASLDAAGPDCAPAHSVDRILLPDGEVGGANVLAIDGTALLSAGNPTAARRLAERGLRVVELELDEFARADGGPTCLVNVVP